MGQIKAGEVKAGDVILVYGEEVSVKRVETSGKGIKQGRVKVRIEGVSVKEGKAVVLVRLADDVIQTP